MKKLFLIISMTLICLSVKAQIFTEKDVYDKFDDIVSSKTIKSLITYNQDDGIITIEEKGYTPVEYVVIQEEKDASLGTKDNVVNLVNDIYGYQVTWSVILKSDVDKFTSIVEGVESEELSQEDAVKKLKDIWFYITHRVVTTQYTHDYETELWWVMSDKTHERTIYSK